MWAVGALNWRRPDLRVCTFSRFKLENNQWNDEGTSIIKDKFIENNQPMIKANPLSKTNYNKTRLKTHFFNDCTVQCTVLRVINKDDSTEDIINDRHKQLHYLSLLTTTKSPWITELLTWGVKVWYMHFHTEPWPWELLTDPESMLQQAVAPQPHLQLRRQPICRHHLEVQLTDTQWETMMITSTQYKDNLMLVEPRWFAVAFISSVGECCSVNGKFTPVNSWRFWLVELNTEHWVGYKGLPCHWQK